MVAPVGNDSSTQAALNVIEVGRGAATAYAARLLADLGARVTKLALDDRSDDTAVALDVGKKTCALPEDGDLEQLLAGADVLLFDNGAAGTLPTLTGVRERYPALITATVTPFGESGPHAGWQGTDLIALHAGGLGYGTPPRVTDPEREYPLTIPGDPVSLLCGVALSGGVLHALLERDGDGQGRHVEISAQEVVASCMFNSVAGALSDGPPPSRLASARLSARKPMLTCADGAVAAMVNRPGHVRAWLEAIGPGAAPLLAQLEAGVPPVELRAAIDEAAEAWAAGRSKHEVATEGQARHVPVAPVLGPGELLDSPQPAARGFWHEVRSGDRSVRIPRHPFGPLAEGDAPRQLLALAPALAGDGPGPLSGVTVVDFGWIFAGPIATRMLAALGATVLRIEHLGRPDQMRERPFSFRVVNGDKESLELDAKSDAGRAALRALLADADVLAENFAPGAMERLGLDWATVHALNPRLIMLSISGMGQTGPLRHWAMLGQLAQAYAGLTAMVGYEDGPPRGIEDGGFWTDPVTGYAATVALLAALRERAVTGAGRRIDVSLVEATAALFIEPLLAAQRGDVWGPRGNVHPAMAPHDVYRCAGGPGGAAPAEGGWGSDNSPNSDDRWLAVAARDDAEWGALCAVIGRPDLARDPALTTLAGRQAQRDRLRAEIEAWTRVRSAEDAAAALQAAGVPATPSHNAPELLADPHLRARGFFAADAEAPGSVLMRAFPPWRLHPAGAVRYGPAPRLGERAGAEVAAG